MANPKIKIKRSAVAGKVPHYPDNIGLGEFAINHADGKVFIAAGQAGVGIGTTVIEVGISTNRILSGIATITTLEATNLTVTNQITGISSGAAKVETATDGGNQWHHVAFLDNRTGYQKIKTNGLTYNPSTGKLYAGIGSFHTITGDLTGDVTGDVTGDLTGDVTGSLTGPVTGEVTGNVTGNLTGNVTGNISGEVTADQLRVTGIATFQGNVNLGDDDRLRFGDGEDLQIFHNSSNNNSVIQETGNGSLIIAGNDVQIRNAGSNENKAKFITDGAVELYYDNSKKFETTATGATVTGHVVADGFTGNINSTGISTISGFTFPGSDGTSGQVLGTDGAGQLTFITASSAGSATTVTNLHWTVGVGSTAFQSPEDLTDETTLVFNNGSKLALTQDYYIESNTVFIKNGALTQNDRIHVTIHYDSSFDSEFFTATDGQTSFDLAATLLSSQDKAKVYLNGAKLRGTVDYSISQTVVLNVGAESGDLINISADAGESYTIASDGQTSFTYTSSSITASNLIVYQNGIRLEPGDYSVGSLTLLLTQGAEVGDSVDVLLYA